MFDHAAGNNTGLGWLDKDTVEPTRKITNILIWIFALVMPYPYLPGAQTEAFKGMSVLIGPDGVAGRVEHRRPGASGLILMYSRTLRTGEYVRIGDHEGTVVAINLQHPPAHGRGAEITLPNSLIVRQRHPQLLRTQGGRGFMLDTTVTIGYDTPGGRSGDAHRSRPEHPASPPTRPRASSRQPCQFLPRILSGGAPPRSAPSLGRSCCRDSRANIQDVFNEYGVRIMSPTTSPIRQQKNALRPITGIHRPRRPDGLSGGLSSIVACPEPP